MCPDSIDIGPKAHELLGFRVSKEAPGLSIGTVHMLEGIAARLSQDRP